MNHKLLKQVITESTSSQLMQMAIAFLRDVFSREKSTERTYDPLITQALDAKEKWLAGKLEAREVKELIQRFKDLTLEVHNQGIVHESPRWQHYDEDMLIKKEHMGLVVALLKIDHHKLQDRDLRITFNSFVDDIINLRVSLHKSSESREDIEESLYYLGAQIVSTQS